MEIKPLQEGAFLKDKWYKIKKKIGEGGFGITYLADELFSVEVLEKYGKKKIISRPVPQRVVIKELFYADFCKRDDDANRVVPANEFLDQWNDLKRRMEGEGLSLSKFDNEHIVGVRDAFQENNTLYTVMDYIDGSDLEAVLEKKKLLPAATGVNYMIQILSALGAIHDQKIYHFDVKPGNIMIDKETDTAILIDFGAALAYDSDGKLETMKSRLSKIKNVQGTSIPYCPLEIETGDFDFTKLDEAIDCPKTIDLYSAGATLYRCLTGQIPPSAVKLNSGRQREQLQIPENLKEKIDSRYLEVIRHSMENIVRQRFQTAYEFIVALEDISLGGNNSFYGYFSKAKIAADRNDRNKAIEYFNKAILTTHNLDAADELRRKRVSTCEQEIKKINESEPVEDPDKNYKEQKKKFNELFNEGEKAFGLKDYQSAKEYYEQAVEIATTKVLTVRPAFNSDFDVNKCNLRVAECIRLYRTRVVPPPGPAPSEITEKKKRNPLFIIIAIAILLVAGATCYYYPPVGLEKFKPHRNDSIFVDDKDTARQIPDPLSNADSSFSKGDYDSAFRIYITNKQNLSREQMQRLGTIYENGWGGIATSPSEAVQWYKRAADLDDTIACRKMASFYSHGKYGLSQSKYKTYYYYRKAALQHDAHAEYNTYALMTRLYPDEKDSADYWLSQSRLHGYIPVH